MKNRVTNLRWVGLAEGISFLVLLLIAMPLKYFFNWPLAVTVVGWAHGVLFVLYIAVVFVSVKIMKWNLIQLGFALAASVIPGGTFYLDKSWKVRELELSQSATETLAGSRLDQLL